MSHDAAWLQSIAPHERYPQFTSQGTPAGHVMPFVHEAFCVQSKTHVPFWHDAFAAVHTLSQLGGVTSMTAMASVGASA